MTTTIASLMTKEVTCVGMDDTIEAVEAVMKEHKLRWVPVTGPDGAALGVISMSDLVRFHADRRDAAATCAWQVCSYKPISVPIDTPVGEVARSMIENGVHHVVVLDGGSVRGVVSSLDFVRRFVSDD